MLAFLSAVAFSVAAVAPAAGSSEPIDASSNYIVGGNAAKPNEYPWMASIQNFQTDAWTGRAEFMHVCGAVILNDRWLVTARHCVDDKMVAARQVVTGAHRLLTGGEQEPGRQTLEIVQIVEHKTDDLALVEVEAEDGGRIQFEKRVAPICLWDWAAQGSPPVRGLTAAGWGKQAEHSQNFTDTLQTIQVNLVSYEQCLRAYRNLNTVRVNAAKHVCAGRLGFSGRGICMGDTGGPLTTRDKEGTSYLVGVALTGAECGSKEHPGIYMKLAPFMSWIQETTSGYDELIPCGKGNH